VKRKDADYERLAKYAKQLDPDVIAVQEVDGEAALRRVFDDAEYDYHVASQNGVQLTGFAYKATLSVTKNPDVDSLDVGSVRVGTDLTVNINNEHVRLLSVHLKSGCFDEPLSSTTPVACVKLEQQLPKLEEWIDARATANEAFVCAFRPSWTPRSRHRGHPSRLSGRSEATLGFELPLASGVLLSDRRSLEIDLVRVVHQSIQDSVS
jgi:hypothetical protein